MLDNVIVFNYHYQETFALFFCPTAAQKSQQGHYNSNTNEVYVHFDGVHGIDREHPQYVRPQDIST